MLLNVVLYDIRNYKNSNIMVSEDYHIINHKLKNLYSTCTSNEDKKKELEDYLKNKNINGRILIEILGDKFKNKFLDSLLEKK